MGREGTPGEGTEAGNSLRHVCGDQRVSEMDNVIYEQNWAKVGKRHRGQFVWGLGI